MNIPHPNDWPDPRRFIVTARQAVIADLVDLVTQGTRLLALTGAAGVGKTTVALAMQHELADRSVQLLHIHGAPDGRIDLRSLTCQLLDKPETEFTADDIEALFDVMTTRQHPDQRLVLVIDDAERLGADALGYLHLLSSIAMDEMPQIIFVGRPSFWDAAEQPTKADMREQVAERRELQPLTDEEAKAFVEQSASASSFGEGALDALVRRGNGLIGRLDALLVLARTIGDERQLQRLTAAVIDAAAARLDAAVAEGTDQAADLPETAAGTPEPAPTEDAPRAGHRRFVVTLAAVLVVALMGAVGYWQVVTHGYWMAAKAGSVEPAEGSVSSQVPAQDAVPPAALAEVVDAHDPPAEADASQPAAPRVPTYLSWLLADILDVEVAAASPPEVPGEAPTPAKSASLGDDSAAGPPVVRADLPPDRLGDDIMPPVADAGTAEPDGETRAGFADLPPDRVAHSIPDAAASTAGSDATPQDGTPAAVAADLPPDRIADDRPTPATADAGMASASPVVASADDRRPAERPPERPAATQDLTALLARGDAMLELGDVVAARLFYEHAASLGSARGATSLGKTYDPVFLASVQAAGIAVDRKLAAGWYRKGAALGDTEGSRRLAVLTADP